MKFYVETIVQVTRTLWIEAEDADEAAKLVKEGYGDIEESTEGEIEIVSIDEAELD